MPLLNRSRVKTAGLFVLAGALLNVFIAWGLAIINTPEVLPEEQVVVDTKDWPMPPPMGWPAYERRSSGPADVVDTEWVLWGATRGGAAMEKADVGYLMQTRSAGAPFRCLVGGRCSVMSPSRAVVSDTRRFALGPLPLFPLWRGFALNTILYTLIALGLWQIRLEIRRRTRYVKGLCVRCGYDRAGIAPEAPCPECGSMR